MTDQAACTHKKFVQGKWNKGYEDYDGDIVGSHWEEDTWESTYADIDLHRYRCTQCGELNYYSEAARKFYEEGIESPFIKGLHHD